MPRSAPKPCSHPGCKQLVTDGTARCAEHKPKSNAHGSVGKRSTGRKGVADRERIKRRDKGICQQCLKDGKIKPGTEVDHIIRLSAGGQDDDANKWLLCARCHAAKTAAERRRAGRGG